MKVGIVGGGPAGLLFAYLLKRHDAAHGVRVVERDPAGATYGWGVVFSDVALAFVRDAAPALHDALAREQEVHDAMRIVHRGHAVTLAGHRFHRMARIDLLRVLGRHCADLGVELDLGRKLEDPGELGDCDLFVAADGAASTVRSRHQAEFAPILDVRRNLLAWYGTTQLFDPLTLIFHAHQGSLYIAHAYRYSRTHSTFLVECDPDAWRAAGLDRMGVAEGVATCERIFADYLGGQPLLSNHSEWFRYTIVTSRRWHSRNIVLLGDALRTGHPSVGSGTRMAMQDAIALFEAYLARGDEVPALLADFERRRRPGSEALQAAAVKSAEWYESVRSKLHLDPVSFAYDYVRRTGRVSHADVRRRDPALAAAYEALHPEEAPP